MGKSRWYGEKNTSARVQKAGVCPLSLQLTVGPWIINLTPVSFSFLLCKMNDWTIWLGFKEDAVNLIILWLDIEHKTRIWLPLADWDGQGSLDYSAMHRDERSSQSLPLLLLTNRWVDILISRQIKSKDEAVEHQSPWFILGWKVSLRAGYFFLEKFSVPTWVIAMGSSKTACFFGVERTKLTLLPLSVRVWLKGFPAFHFKHGPSVDWAPHGCMAGTMLESRETKAKKKATRGLNCSLEARCSREADCGLGVLEMAIKIIRRLSCRFHGKWKQREESMQKQKTKNGLDKT